MILKYKWKLQMKSSQNTKIQIIFWRYIVPKTKISLATREVFLYLLKMSGDDPPEASVVSRTNEQIAFDLTLSEKTVDRAMKQLMKIGLIIRIRKGVRLSNVKTQSKYRIPLLDEIVRNFLNENEKIEVQERLKNPEKKGVGQNVPLQMDKMSL